ncbi:MAG: tetratricopeptide repeat protein [Elusimicrobia bacterium]|nr:tetratricopeptide repeat protein [Elusimicrobiota bacterium]
MGHPYAESAVAEAAAAERMKRRQAAAEAAERPVAAPPAAAPEPGGKADPEARPDPMPARRRTPAPSRAAVTNRSKARQLLTEGLQALRRREFNGAIAAFQRASEADPGSAQAFFQLGNAFFQRGFQRGTPDRADADDTQRALEAYQTSMALDPELKGLGEPFLLYHGMGQCLESLGRYDEAAEQMRRAAKAAPHNPMPMLYAAELRHRMRDMKKSAENLHQGVLRARRIGAYRSMAKLVRSHPQFAGMLRLPQNRAVLDAYDKVEAGKLAEGQAMDQVEEQLGMRDALRDTVREPADESRARIVAAPRADPRIQELLEQADGDFKWRQFRRAIVGYEQALREDRTKGSLDGAQRASVLERAGAAYRQLGLTNEAVQTLERSAQEGPRNPSTYYQLALAYSTAGQFTSALNALDKSFRHAQGALELRKTLLLARTDTELEPLRDLPAFQRMISTYALRARARVP